MQKRKQKEGKAIKKLQDEIAKLTGLVFTMKEETSKLKSDSKVLTKIKNVLGAGDQPGVPTVERGEKYCAICQKQFKDGYTLRLHVDKWHKGSTRFQCDHYSKFFANLKNLRLHKASHSPSKRKNCVHCPQTFGSAKALKRYMLNKHASGPSSFNCEFCGKSFIVKHYKDKHQIVCE